ncbi:hypothetical protein M0R45_024452 [Rubus argutus]|uniref:Short-chain dehydrogenase/reductase n=1 Tax=Rubus argutus TaxID=59490 RepID=A0AAW1WR64_RUBAR
MISSKPNLESLTFWLTMQESLDLYTSQTTVVIEADDLIRHYKNKSSFARDVKRGTEAVEKLKASGFSNVVFHLLDVTDPATIASLADFLKTQFGKIDILVNNAGVRGAMYLTDDIVEPDDASQ